MRNSFTRAAGRLYEKKYNIAFAAKKKSNQVIACIHFRYDSLFTIDSPPFQSTNYFAAVQMSMHDCALSFPFKMHG